MVSFVFNHVCNIFNSYFSKKIMDYIVITRDEYAEFHIKEHRGYHHTLSPDDIDLWRLNLYNEFDRLQAIDNQLRRAYSVKILFYSNYALLILGIISAIYLAINGFLC